MFAYNCYNEYMNKENVQEVVYERNRVHSRIH